MSARNDERPRMTLGDVAMSARPWVLAEMTHDAVRAQKWEAAVLPFGATEPQLRN